MVIGGDSITIVWPKLWLVAVAGIFFALATLALFAAFALGPMTIVAPIVRSYPALAVLFAVAQGARPSAMQWLAIACVMAGAVIISRSGGRYQVSGALTKGEMRSVIGLAGLGRTLLCDRRHRQPGRGADFRRCAYGVARQDLRSPHHRPDLSVALAGRAAAPAVAPLLALMGCLDVAALAALTAAGNLPSPEFTTVVSSAFGAITVILARVFLKEPISLVQLGGIVLIFGGVASLAALGLAARPLLQASLRDRAR